MLQYFKSIFVSLVSLRGNVDVLWYSSIENTPRMYINHCHVYLPIVERVRLTYKAHQLCCEARLIQLRFTGPEMTCAASRN